MYVVDSPSGVITNASDANCEAKATKIKRHVDDVVQDRKPKNKYE